MNCCSSSFKSKASAGGQVEQPSEVKSSTTTGVRVCGEEDDCARTLPGQPAKVIAAKMKAVAGLSFIPIAPGASLASQRCERAKDSVQLLRCAFSASHALR